MEKKIKESNFKQKMELNSEERKTKSGGQKNFSEKWIVVYCPDCKHIFACVQDFGMGSQCKVGRQCHFCETGLTAWKTFTTSEFIAKFGFAPYIL